MLITSSILEHLAGRIDDGSTGLQVASVPVDVDPLAFVRAAHPLAEVAVYFGRPGDVEIGAVGIAWESNNRAGNNRLKSVKEQLPDLPGARFVLGYSFSPDGPSAEEWTGYGPVRVILPTAAIVQDHGESHLVVAVSPERRDQVFGLLEGIRARAPEVSRHAADRSIESIPAPGDWIASVEDAVAAIEDGVFEKVVLARSVVVKSDVPSDPFDLAYRLRAGHPGCFTYAWKNGRSAFVGASPELLASVRGSQVVSEPLAGTTARGESDDHDRLLGEQLMASPKNRHEHRLVIDDLQSHLGPLTTALEVPSAPNLRRMANVQHLATRIRGDLVDSHGLLDVVDALHPTPAVGGSPTADALAMIDKLESIDRGWYAGGVGWVDGSGDGDVAVALRCALLRGSTARLFAGAGIVAGSIPYSELEETRLKFGPMLSLLTEA